MVLCSGLFPRYWTNCLGRPVTLHPGGGFGGKPDRKRLRVPDRLSGLYVVSRLLTIHNVRSQAL
jgi:hypothetical protein